MERVGAHTGTGARIAALTTRRAKPQGISETELRAEWRQRALDHRFDLDGVVRVPRTPQLRVSDDELAAALTVQHATFDRGDAPRAVARAARQGADLTTLTGRTEEFLGSAAAAAVGDGRWTTQEILDLEQHVVALDAAAPTMTLAAEAAATTIAVESRPSLTGEQRQMVTRLCQSGRTIDVVVGHAGTGKTFTLDAVRAAFESSGHRVLGAALAARAARELQSGSGISSMTAHALHADVTTGRLQLQPGDVLVVDEAGMLGTRLLAALARDAATAQAKLILVGDPKQLPAVEAGGLFTALTLRLPVVELIENRRQHNPVDRQVGTLLRHGHNTDAISRLDRAGQVTVANNSDTLRTQMISDWQTHRTAGRDVLLGATSRADVRDLNARAHAVLEQTGQLGPLVAEVDGQRFCVGDQVLALRNRYDLGIVNGDLARITGADQGGLRLQTADRGEITVPLSYVAEHLQHGYARTIHKSQGLTCDVALLLGDDTLYAELGYTALTRGRHRNQLYTVATDNEDGRFAQLIAALDTSRAKIAAIDAIDAPDVAVRG